MMRITWSRVCAYALIYFALGVAASTATAYWSLRYGPGVGESMVIAGWVTSTIVAALASIAFAACRPVRSFVHAALAYSLAELLGATCSALLLGSNASLSVMALDYAVALVAVFVGTAIGLWFYRARLGASNKPLAGGS